MVPIHEAGERDGQLYLAMRYVEGSDLSAVLARERTLPPERALAVLAQIADALDTAHRRDLVHRDVKPANVLLDEDEHVYLTDFGVTKQVGGASTDTGRVVGTLDYLAPEQIRGEAVDGRTDSYALACVLYECLSGTPPFRRDTEAETLWAHMHEQPAPLPGYAALDPVLARGLAKERDERYGSCAELIEDARRAIGLRAAAPVRRTRVPSWLRRRGRTVLAAGLLVLGARTRRGDRRPDDRCRQPSGAARERGRRDRRGRWHRLVRRRRHGPEQHRRRRGRGLGPEHGGRHRLPYRPRDRRRSSRRSRRAASPSDLAVGAGALWVGHGGGRPPFVTESISRIDPESAQITRTVKLPDTSGGVLGAPSMGIPPDRGRSRRGMGEQPRRERLPHRPRDRQGLLRRSTSASRPGGSRPARRASGCWTGKAARSWGSTRAPTESPRGFRWAATSCRGSPSERAPSG